jgi:TonB family protein
MNSPNKVILLLSFALIALVPIASSAQEPVLKAPTLDSKPVLLSMSMPVLPESMSEEKGKVLISCSIDEQGKTRRLRVEESSNPTLNEVALSMVSAWVYQPATKNGRAVAIEVLLPISFI